MADNDSADFDVKLDPDPILVPLALIAPAITVMVTLPLFMAYAAVAAGIALVGAVVLGAPVLALAHRFGFRGLIKTTALGAVTASVGVLAASAVATAIRFRYRLQVDESSLLAALAAAIGGGTGAVYATIFDSENLERHQVRWRVLIIVLVALTIPFAVIAWQKTSGAPSV